MTVSYATNKEYNSVSRYQVLRRVVEDNDEINSYLETQNQRFVKETDQDMYHIVKSSEVNRLDLISNQYYGTPIYWWAIALANEFIDPFILNEGELIRIPSLATLNSSSQRILVI